MSQASTAALPRNSPRTQRTRRAILEAAARCFGEHGFADCSMDAVAEAAGITKPTIYAHFTSKEALFDTLLRASLLRRKSEPLPCVTTLAQLEAALLSHARSYLDFTLREPNLGLLRAAAAELMRRPAWAREMLAGLSDDELPRLFADLHRLGVLHAPKPKVAVEHYWALVKGQLFYPVVLGLRDPLEGREGARVLRQSVSAFLAAYQA